MIDRLNTDAQPWGPAHAPRKSCGGWNFVVAFGALLTALFVLGACSSEAQRPGSFDGVGGEGGPGSGVAQGPCKEGARKECGFTVNQDDQVITCFHGVQECGDDGTWGECTEGELVTMPAGDDDDFTNSHRRFDPLTTSTQPHTACDPLDRCDPRCVQVAEPSAVFTPGTRIVSNELCEPTDTTPLAECSPGPGCEHSLCTTGVGLTASRCGACAQKMAITSGVPATCFGSTGTWDATCVNKAFEVCLNSPPPIGICEFGVFSETTLTTANAPSFGTASTIGAVGNLTLGTDAAGQFPTRVVTTGDLWIENSNKNGNIPVSGGMWASGSIGFKAGTTTSWTMDIHSGEGVFLFSQNTINGKVYTSGDYNNSVSGASATTTCNVGGESSASISTAYATTVGEIGTSGMPASTCSPTTLAVTTKAVNTLPAPTINVPTSVPPPVAMTCSSATNFPTMMPTTGLTINNAVSPKTVTVDNRAYSLPPGNYGTVTLMNGGKLVLTGNASAYTFTAINGGSSGAGGIQLAAATGTYNVTVCGSLSLGNGASIVDSTASTTATTNTPVVTDPSRLVMYVLADSTTAVNFGLDVNFTGVLVVPNGTFKTSNNNNHSNCSVMPWNSAQCTKFQGAVWAEAFDVGTYFNLVQIGKTACEGLSLSGATPPTPPAASCTSLDTGAMASTPALLPSSAEPCRWAADCQNNQRCTNVESRVGTDDCNNLNKCVAVGTALGPPSGLVCAADPCVGRIIAQVPGCGTSWTQTCVDAVRTVCDATCGTPATNRTGICVENAMGYTDSSCASAGTNDYDLALAYGCSSSQISVCNHGTDTFSGNVTVGFWNVTDRQFATLPGAAPNTGTMDGACTQSRTIAPGACSNLALNATTCMPAAPVAGTNYTFMVDPNGALSECGTASNTNRRLDNWAWREASFTCIDDPDYSEYEYVANCPNDSSANWKNLSWVTTNSMGSQVQFLGKVANDLAGLSAATYYPLYTNTTSCTQAQADVLTAGCYVGLTSTLNLEPPQGQALSIRAEKTGTPTISKWEVTYTCQYDQ